MHRAAAKVKSTHSNFYVALMLRMTITWPPKIMSHCKGEQKRANDISASNLSQAGGAESTL